MVSLPLGLVGAENAHQGESDVWRNRHLMGALPVGSVVWISPLPVSTRETEASDLLAAPGVPASDVATQTTVKTINTSMNFINLIDSFPALVTTGLAGYNPDEAFKESESSHSGSPQQPW